MRGLRRASLHARDRLWQMELYRRVTLGTAVRGAWARRRLPIDQRFLTLGLREAAAANGRARRPRCEPRSSGMPPGVNAVAATLTGRRGPIEFQVLGITPAPWTPEDSLAVGRLLAWRLAENHQAELVRGALAAKFGEAAARELGGRYPRTARRRS